MDCDDYERDAAIDMRAQMYALCLLLALVGLSVLGALAMVGGFIWWLSA